METALNLALNWLRDWSSVISGLGSLVLTAGLVYLYKIQHGIQVKQTELAEKQQRPILRIEDYRLFSGADVEKILNENEIPLNSYQPRGFLLAIVSNFGKGAANGLHAEVVFDTGDILLRTLLRSTLLISERSFDSVFECLSARFPVEFSPELERSEVLGQLVL